MKKIVAISLSAVLCMGTLAACGSSEAAEPTTELVVVTSYGGDDGNRKNYEDAYKAYEVASGNKVLDASGTSNEEWKSKVMADFQTGAEPDVLFYFTGVDANPIIEGQKVVSLDTIRAEYPDYANNMIEDRLPVSAFDGEKYTVPVNGFWEGLFVNKTVLAASGVEVPGADYTWDQFLIDCEKIKTAGYTPIAASLQDVPHYWFEFSVYNNGNTANHTALPTSSTDEAGQKWAAGLNDIKDLYEKGYFPENTLTSTDPEAVQLMADNEAAFLIDGSWKLGWFNDNAKNEKDKTDIEDFTVTYIPGKGERAATDIVGGISMGYYITQKAWDDPEKRQAAVDFVTAMTTDEVVSKFGAASITALKNGVITPDELGHLESEALKMTNGSNDMANAAQDGLILPARTDLFANVKNIVSGTITSEEAIDSALALNK